MWRMPIGKPLKQRSFEVRFYQELKNLRAWSAIWANWKQNFSAELPGLCIDRV